MSWLKSVKAKGEAALAQPERPTPRPRPIIPPTLLLVQIRQPKDNDPGQVAEAWYMRDGDTLRLTDEYGRPIAGKSTQIGPGDDARALAYVLAKQHLTEGRTGFNGRLDYSAWTAA